jgi:hypothetical protein
MDPVIVGRFPECDGHHVSVSRYLQHRTLS